MAQSTEAKTLQVAFQANAAAYRRALQTSAPGECWDFVVLTATNDRQARGYEQELALRHRAVGPAGAFFPAIQRSLVVADPPGPRIGSGGATLNALRQLIRRYNLTSEDFNRLRILLIHSGGMSQRLPMYSPVGKIFASLPLPRPDGQIATLFDHLYLTLAGLPQRLGPGLLVLAGDVFLLFDHRHVSAPKTGVTALTMRVDAEMGRAHGVFVTNKQNQIRHTLQKPTTEQMHQRGAIDNQGKILIDSGLLFFDAPTTRKLSSLAGWSAQSRRRPAPPLHEKFRTPLDLYEEMAAALTHGLDQKTFLSDPARRPLRRILLNTLHGSGFTAMEVGGEFLHLGTTLQFRDAMTGRSTSPAAELFQQNVLTHSQWKLSPNQRVYHSVLLAEAGHIGQLGAGSVIEHSFLRAPSRIGSGCVVSQVLVDRQPIDLGDNLLLFQVPVRDETNQLRFAHVCAGVEDDFKGRFDQDACRYLNQPMGEWLNRHGVSPRDIWPAVPPDQRTLWTARLFPITADRDCARRSVRLAGAPMSAAERTAWKRSCRYSMAMILESADPQRLIEHRETIAAQLQSMELLQAVQQREDRPIGSIIGRYASHSAYTAAEGAIQHWAQQSTENAQHSIDQARAFWSISQLLKRPDYPDPADAHKRLEPAMRSAFSRIAAASEIGYRSISIKPRVLHRLQPGWEIIAAAPVRLDLAGGWTDTPPYCFERGGHVVNVAINLNGQPPVRAIVRTLKQPKIILESNDLGRSIELTRHDQIIDVHDPFALHKVALGMTGLLPSVSDNGAPSSSLTTFLRKLGAGLHITTECRVPKGSGLGTSSILAATLLAALHKVRNTRVTLRHLMEQTLLLEQRLSTGGGWQDQVGGIVGGIKSIRSQASIPQQLEVESLDLSDQQYQAIQDRLVVYYSGQQRLARDILRRVMGRWLAREPAILDLMNRLGDGARGLRQALLKSQWRSAGQHIASYWQIKKELYPGSTTPEVDVMQMEMRADYLAAGLAGAGGGGFGYFFCADAHQAERLRRHLRQWANRPGSLGSLFETQINRTGLIVRKKRLRGS
ncbi:MAG: hypothetical protein IT448_10120 [Phycisphaerales bacterium]|nr:hypothetical protein [Phycisphaerales bacterium]